MAELEAGSTRPWYPLLSSSCEGGCSSGARSVVPRGNGGGDADYDRRVSRAPQICLTRDCLQLLVTAYGLG